MKKPGWPTRGAQEVIARRLDLPYNDLLQDWEWTVADTERFDEFLSMYLSEDLIDGMRISLMEILIQCVEDTAPESTRDSAWSLIEPLLRADIYRRLAWDICRISTTLIKTWA